LVERFLDVFKLLLKPNVLIECNPLLKDLGNCSDLQAVRVWDETKRLLHGSHNDLSADLSVRIADRRSPDHNDGGRAKEMHIFKRKYDSYYC